MTKSNSNGKSRRGLLIAIAIVLIAAVAGGVIWKKTRKPEILYKAVKVRRGDLNLTVLATGTVQPENRLEIKSPISGRAEQILVDEGRKVRKGEILAWISSTERAALLDAARSQGSGEFKRWEELYRPTPVVAPINGTIISRNIESGQTFTTADAILVMSDRLTVKAQVDETDMAKIKLKQRADITLDAYGDKVIPAHVDQIAFEAKTVNSVTTYIVDVLPDEAPDFMRSGMTANVTFFLDSRQGVLLVPADAVSLKEGAATVLVQRPDHPPAETEVEIGATDGKLTEVASGLSESDSVMIVQKNFSAARASDSSSPFGMPRAPRRGGGSGGGRH